MTYDLRREPWLPLRRRSGTVEWGTIASIVARMEEDPVVGVATPRPDFDGALPEFLIGLLTAALAPRDLDAWLEGWETPPTEARLQACLDAVPAAFDVDGDGPRFLQDASAPDLAGQELSSVQDLLLDNKNSSLFVKSGVVTQMSRAAAAMALITAQTYSTAGGRGYRTGMRGGGPLTTLVDPRPLDGAEASLWHFLWANVETLEQLRGRGGHRLHGAPADTYPWLGPTRTSDPAARGGPTTTEDAHPLQAYFGMPRRIRLEFLDQPGTCDLTGLHDARMVSGFRVKGYGTQYLGWEHPLSPHYTGKQITELLPAHPQPGGIGWRDWLPLMHAESGNGKKPAATVAAFAGERADAVSLGSFSIRAYGYDASNATLRAWISASLPAFPAADPARLDTLVATVRNLVDATEDAGYLLKSAVIKALHASDQTPADYPNLRTALWRATEGWFFSTLEMLARAEDIRAAAAAKKLEYATTLTSETLRIFDRHAPTDATNPEVLRRVIRARFGLGAALRGGGKMGEKISIALGREPAKPPKKKSETTKTSAKATSRTSPRGAK